ncbi:molybdopterin molybdotransferase MoeA [Belliella sp. R4-6]|uniref:Molybdopterin molybdenumtransferase n=1 Tax=Belliella alkalica TaxID=1730871 RepID=A0ABS9VEC5_9BACT|nr:gephyrin-like molybdotransferase Glp [Belliella alkalica]MCH7414800.1 molybdopterin molybdotransferase MoeA [Belliella alkalica]
MNKMITVDIAKSILKSLAIQREMITIPIVDAVDCFCAEAVFSPISVPSFDNSAMDGYALCFDELQSEMEISAMVKAGSTTKEAIKTGTAVRIFTGAPIPSGADTVVKQEIVRVNGNRFSIDPSLVNKGDFVRVVGAQCKADDEILGRGDKISFGTIALLASLGVQDVKVFRKPKVGVILTGDEVVTSELELQDGQIYDANGPMLCAALMKLGIQVEFVEKVKDEAFEVEASIKKLIEKVDVLILSGGISVGDFDFVRPALQNLGIEELFYKVAQKPGKPFYAGVLGSKFIFALPGNPSSSLSCFQVYVRPFLNRFSGDEYAYDSDFKFPLVQEYKTDSSLTFFLKCELKNNMVRVLNGQESFNLVSFNKATGLVEIPSRDAQDVNDGLYNYYPF